MKFKLESKSTVQDLVVEDIASVEALMNTLDTSSLDQAFEELSDLQMLQQNIEKFGITEPVMDLVGGTLQGMNIRIDDKDACLEGLVQSIAEIMKTVIDKIIEFIDKYIIGVERSCNALVAFSKKIVEDSRGGKLQFDESKFVAVAMIERSKFLDFTHDIATLTGTVAAVVKKFDFDRPSESISEINNILESNKGRTKVVGIDTIKKNVPGVFGIEVDWFVTGMSILMDGGGEESQKSLTKLGYDPKRTPLDIISAADMLISCKHTLDDIKKELRRFTKARDDGKVETKALISAAKTQLPKFIKDVLNLFRTDISVMKKLASALRAGYGLGSITDSDKQKLASFGKE